MNLPRFDAAPLEGLPEAISALFPEGIVAVLKNFENYIVVLKNAAAVRAHVADSAAITRLGDSGIAITAAGGTDHAGAPVDFTSRYFAPSHGIDEDPVTGSIHATLAPYWAGVLGRSDLTAFQASARGGRIGCRVTEDRVSLTGQAVTYLKGTISLPV